MRFTVPDHVHYRDLHDEIVLLDSRSDAYLGLNPSAAIVWSTLAGGHSTGQAADALIERFGISATVAERDVATLITDLERRGLLMRASE